MKNTDNTNAVFTIKNNQSYSDHEESIEITTAGKFYLKNGKYYLLYKEYAEIGDISVVIKAEGNKVSVRRSGACSSVMNHEENCCEEILYSLPYGDIVIETKTHSVQNMLSEEGGCLMLKYDISFGGEGYSNEIIINVKSERNERVNEEI